MSSVFSRTMMKSRSSRRLRAPLYALTGRTSAYRSRACRKATLTLRKPLPIGVVVGKGRAELRNGGFACLVDVPLELDAGCLEHPHRGFADLGTDTVARDQRYCVL